MVTGASDISAQRLTSPKTESAITITINGHPVEAYPGETIAVALLASGQRIFRRSTRLNSPRGFFCGMGICFDCLVTVDGVPNIRSCMTEVRPGCVVEVQAK